MSQVVVKKKLDLVPNGVGEDLMKNVPIHF